MRRSMYWSEVSLEKPCWMINNLSTLKTAYVTSSIHIYYASKSLCCDSRCYRFALRFQRVGSLFRCVFPSNDLLLYQ